MTDLRADELVKLADRIVSQPTSWLPITGHCRNITFTLDECDVIATALRRLAEAGTQPEPVAWQFQCANGAWIACDRPSPSELSDEPDKFRCLYTASPADAGMREVFVRVLASLAAAISILERTPKAKKAVASDKMFDTMLNDYRKALEIGRAALTAPGATTKSDDGFLGTLPSGESEPVVTPTYLSSDTYTIAHDDFTGTVQGRYVTREGKEGVVLQQVGTRVVHVYGRKWIDGSATSDPSFTRSDELDDRERDYALYGLREEDLP